MEKRILKIFSDKPELVTDFPEWMLPSKTIKLLQNENNSAIAEIAGRDSITAAVMAVEEKGIKIILPSITYTGTQYGDRESSWRAVSVLKKRLAPLGARVMEPVISGSPSFWWKLCGRYNYQLQRDFGFYSPCIGCHLYFHALRIPLAVITGVTKVIAGERETHDGRIKLNQLGISLEAYLELYREFNLKLLLPLRKIGDGKIISSILKEDWEEGENQLKCVLSKNYIFKDGTVNFSEKAIQDYFRKFALPETCKQLSLWLDNIRTRI